MKSTIIIIVVLLLVVLGIYLITSNNKNTTPINTSQTSTVTTPSQTTTTTTSTTVTSNATPANVSVDIRNLSFNPGVLNIKTGTKVTWINNDNVAHTVTSDSNNLFNSPTLSPGDSFSFTFTNSGSVNYHCNIHTMMQGEVIVQN